MASCFDLDGVDKTRSYISKHVDRFYLEHEGKDFFAGQLSVPVNIPILKQLLCMLQGGLLQPSHKMLQVIPDIVLHFMTLCILQ